MGLAERVIIAGAGPVGMVLALALYKRGIPVTLVEREPAPVEDQRAASIQPSVVEMLDEQGRSDLLSTMSLSDFSTRK